MVLAHPFIGASITYLIVKDLNYSKNFKNLLYFIGIIAAVLPDFDLLLSFFIEDLNHRRLISHSILPYLLFFLGIHFLSKYLKPHVNKIKIINLIIFLGVVSHLLIDFLVGGISLFAPLLPDVFGFILPFPEQNFFLHYFSSYYLILELLIISIFFYLLPKEKSLIFRVFPIFFMFVAIAMVFRFSLI